MKTAMAALVLFSLHAQDAREIVRQSVSKDMRNWPLARNYTYVEKKTTSELDKRGGVKSSNSETAEVVMLCGAPYRRLIERQGVQLAGKDERRQEERIDRLSGEDSKDCAKRQAAVERRRLKEREFLKDLPDAFNFRLLGLEKIAGKDAYAIAAEPRREYHSPDGRGKFLSKIHGKIWIDKAELQWVKVEAETIDTVSLGLFLFRLNKGASLQFEQARVNDEIWLPRHIHVVGTGRAALLLTGGYSDDIRYDNYKKFSADSRIVSSSEVKP
jgi:hypothetical protein